MLPKRPAIRGLCLLLGALATIAGALLMESTPFRPFEIFAVGVAYLSVVSGLMLGGLFFFSVALFRGPAWERAVSVPCIALILFYHLLLISGPG